jgi:catechol 2,3-dioxygenase-like lactoylglutathione lyase family enzyme
VLRITTTENTRSGSACSLAERLLASGARPASKRTHYQNTGRRLEHGCCGIFEKVSAEEADRCDHGSGTSASATAPAATAATADLGLTHVALLAGDLDRSVAFYRRYAAMEVVHQRADGGTRVAWVSDRTRPFVIVLIELPRLVPRPLLRLANAIRRRLAPFEHLGIGCESREEVDRLVALARADGALQLGPHDYGPPVGYWAFISDPDGHTLEVSHGQEVGLTVAQARSYDEEAPARTSVSPARPE